MLSPYNSEFPIRGPKQTPKNPPQGDLVFEMFVSMVGSDISHRVIFTKEQQDVLADLFATIFPPRTPEAKFDFKVEPVPFKILRPPNV